MEVLVGPTFTLDVSSSPPAYGRDQHAPCDADDHAVPSCLFARPDDGTPDDSDNDLSFKRDGDAEEEEEEVQSKFNGGLGLGSLDSLEDSLPIKRGLSSHFEGKSKSFTDLSQISDVKDLKKQENPFNKRRRLVIASKLSRKSFYSWSNPKSMPLLPVDEDEDDDYEQEKARKVPSPTSSSSSLTEEKKEEDQIQMRQSRVPESYAARMRLRLGSFKSRSFSLADLQEHDDEEEDDD
ncbi:nucleolin 1-like [Senna tora]|uniref:Nucleolin 1-like n=1 Tax=Senna tora TaxID=362788 RepID=A0A834TY84_9FABA|nr:nucleolin 1-like [Senna tora]